MTQGVLIGWIGTALGVALGLALALNVDVIVPFLEQRSAFTSWTRTSTTSRGFRAKPIRAMWSCIAVAALLLTFLATIYPSLRGCAHAARRSAALRMMRYLVRRLHRAALPARLAHAVSCR
jgi:lipoprotein-releasing system permease protein